MKKILLAVLILSAVILVVWIFKDPLMTKAASVFTETRSNATGINGVSTTTLPFTNVTNNATTSRSYIAVGNASTTLTAQVGSADESWMYINVVSSSTATVLRWSVEYSLDNADFYGEDFASTSPITMGTLPFVDHSTSTVIHRWSPNTVSTTTRLVKLPDGVGNFLRVNFSVIGGNASYWADIVKKESRF